MTRTRPTLLLVPGLLCDSGLWRHQLAALSSEVDCVVADVGSHDSVEAMAAAALSAVEGPFSLAGLSLGGYVALEIVRQAPERVARLALVDTQPRPDSEEQSRRRRGFVDQVREGGFDGVVAALVPLTMHPDHVAALEPEFTAMAQRVGPAVFLRQQAAIIARPDSVPSLSAIGCPTLVVCGREDQITPLEGSELMAAEIPGARLEVLEHCGHMSSLEQPDAVTALLRAWLG
jgi:pimeloyl-ACP methyl ester carboxylesterase